MAKSFVHSFCHITPEDCILSILDNGLRANTEGYIYLFEEGQIVHPSGQMLISDAVAISLWKIRDQPYFTLAINPLGIDATPEPAHVNRFGGEFHWKLKQAIILPQYLEAIAYRSADLDMKERIENAIYTEQRQLETEAQHLTNSFLSITSALNDLRTIDTQPLAPWWTWLGKTENKVFACEYLCSID